MSQLKTSGPNATSGNDTLVPSEHTESTTDSGAAVNEHPKGEDGPVAVRWQPAPTLGSRGSPCPIILSPSSARHHPKSVRARRAWPVSCTASVADVRRLWCAAGGSRPSSGAGEFFAPAGSPLRRHSSP
jgi:hypothetical protein